MVHTNWSFFFSLLYLIVTSLILSSVTLFSPKLIELSLDPKPRDSKTLSL
jgi:hypothetical protein